MIGGAGDKTTLRLVARCDRDECPHDGEDQDRDVHVSGFPIDPKAVTNARRVVLSTEPALLS